MFVVILIVILGWAAGMLVNYLADVLPHKRKLVRPFCNSCGANHPTWNYFVWPRECPTCGYRRAWRTWIVEVVAIFTTVFLWFFPTRLHFALELVILIYFGVVLLIDLEHRLILHPVSMVGAGLGVVVGTWLNGLKATLLGGLTGFLIMLLLYYLGHLFARAVSRLRGETLEEEALGFGDVNLSGVLGLMLGWPGILLGLVFSILLGGLVSALLMVGMIVSRRFRSFVAIPYGPFLIAGAIALLYFREFIIDRFGP